MIDPISCVGLATGAFKAIKATVSAGRDLTDCASQLGQWGKAISDFSNIEQREVVNPPWWKKTFKGSDEETALEIFAQKKKMQAMREELRELITWHYGRSGWEELVATEAMIRKRRSDELYKKQQRVDSIINFVIGSIIFFVSGGLLFMFFYFWGKHQGRW